MIATTIKGEREGGRIVRGREEGRVEGGEEIPKDRAINNQSTRTSKTTM